MKLHWRQVDDYHRKSTCERYVVAKVHVMGTVFYEATFINEKREPIHLARAENNDPFDMQRVCQEHAARQLREQHENNDGV